MGAKFEFDANLMLPYTCAADKVRNGLYSRFEQTEKERPEKAVLGYMGEFYFEH